jgi:tetratricopeptide (TPR) repeat protein
MKKLSVHALADVRQLQQDGRLKDAEQACRHLLAQSPESHPVRILLALILTQLQQTEEARSLVDLATLPEDTLVASDQGLLALLQGDIERAGELLQFASQQTDRDAVVFARLGAYNLLQGNLAEAETALREALARSPDHPSILNNLGSLLLRQDKPDEALQVYETALRLCPDLLPSQQGRAAALLLLNRTSEVLDELERQLEKQPDDLQLKQKILHILILEERFEEARILLRELITLSPDNHHYPLQLLNLYAREEQYPMLLKELRPFELDYPEDVGLLNIKARALKEVGKLDQATQVVEQILAKEPNSPQTLITRAMVHADRENYDSAEADLKLVLETHPGLAEAWSLLGHTLLWKGKLNEAVEALQRAATINPAALAALVEARALPEDPAVIRCMQRFATLRLVPREARSAMYFALTKIAERTGDYHQAFDYANEANQLQSHLISHDSNKHHRYTRQIIETFTPALFKKLEGLGNYSERPVFVVGMPRSGTTLTEQILASHPQVFGAGELGVITSITRLMPAVLKIKKPYPLCMTSATIRTIEHASEYYLKALRKRDTSAKRVVDKLPHNFMHLGLISILFPYAKIIHVKRDLRDIAISNYFTNFKMKRGGMSYAFNLEHIGHMLIDYQRIMAHWRKVLPVTIYEYQYEALVAEPEKYEKELIGFLGLDWTPEIRDFYQTERAIRTASVWQVRQPIYNSSRERWRHYEAYLHPLMKIIHQEEIVNES